MTPPPRSWHSIQFIVRPEAVEAIEFALNSLDALGTEANYMEKLEGCVRVSGYFEQAPDSSVVADELQYSLTIHDVDDDVVLSIERSEIQNTDWLTEWKKHWKPTKVGRFTIAPPWEALNDQDQIVIRIEPNMAFGTGTHATTQLCLEMIDHFLKPNDSFLDLGCGTGILAIAAAKLTNGVIVGYDTDADSIKISLENAALNGVSDQIQFQEHTINEQTPQFDFICANLTLAVILPMLPYLIRKAKTTLALSGILLEQQDEIVTALENYGVKHTAITSSGEWIAIKIPMNKS